MATRRCLFCGKEFEYDPATQSQKMFCSSRCRQRALQFKTFAARRFYIFARDRFRCRYCGRTPADGAVLEIDHVFPLARAEGEEAEHPVLNSPVNLVTACRECNRSKKAMLFDKMVYFQIWEENQRLARERQYEIAQLWEEFEAEFSDKEVGFGWKHMYRCFNSKRAVIDYYTQGTSRRDGDTAGE